jgi:uncharacterized protein (DUF1499 family)
MTGRAVLRRVFGALAGLAVATWMAAQLGLFGGVAPADLGVREGRLKAPSSTPNSVSSQAGLWPAGPGTDYARIEPIALRGDGHATMARLKSIVERMPGARIVASRPDYLYVQFTTRWMKFVDDTEFWFDPEARVIQVRSASRVGSGDLGVNRARVEEIRGQLLAP